MLAFGKTRCWVDQPFADFALARQIQFHERRDDVAAVASNVNVGERSVDNHTPAGLDAGERGLDNFAAIVLLLISVVAMMMAASLGVIIVIAAGIVMRQNDR